MDILELIKSRRTIRKFKADPVPQEIRDQILESAIWAPSHRNSQPWEFAIIGPQTRKELLALYHTIVEKLMARPDLTEQGKKALLTLKEDFGGAPLMIAVFSRPPVEEIDAAEYPESVAGAVQNMCLAAWEKGIGAVWLSVGSAPPARKILNIKEGYKVVAVLAMGYPEIIPPAPPREPFQSRLSQLE